jgi:hypothetical protein
MCLSAATAQHCNRVLTAAAHGMLVHADFGSSKWNTQALEIVHGDGVFVKKGVARAWCWRMQ